MRFPLLGRWLSSRRSDWELLKRHGLRPVGGAAAGHVQVAPDSTGKDVDADSLTSTEGGTPTVYRQNVVLADPTSYAAKGAVANAQPAGTEYGLVTRPANPPADKSAIAQALSMASTANAVTLGVQGCGAATIKVTGTWTGNIQTEATTDGTNWDLVPFMSPIGFGYINAGSTITLNGAYWLGLAGWAQLRLRCSSTGTGTATVSIEAGAGAMPFPPTDFLPAGDGQYSGRYGFFINSYCYGYNGAQMDFLRTAAASGIRRGVLQATYPAIPSYAASTNGTVQIPTTLSTTTSLAYLFHGSGVGTRYEIYRIEVDSPGSSTASAPGQVTSIRLARITAENGTPGGTSQTVNPHDPADAASSGTFRTGANAPTRQSGDLYSWNLSTVGANVTQAFVWDALQHNEGKPLVTRASTAEGWELRSVTNGTAIGAAINVGITFWWKEI